MTDQFRAMCAELVAAWDALPWEYDWLGNAIGAHGDLCDDSAVDRARALLAQPVAAGPTDEELWTMYDEMRREQRGRNHGDWAWVRDYARAALAKWGHQ